ncbi:hypothetical protein [Enterobacter pseudoroggenkampii]|uniref:hypothetical protein n=1 Tax=Enterobacter pseudoroggenkampii TaxID=2996112 RepID=UPI002265135B|nr:hypothetical protein [Enterobacter pseudoroggenkampii]MCX8289118.1 hypothetical protein [Enterobacter pseudoroggenkampii]
MTPSIEQLRNTDYYKQLNPERQAQVEKQFNAQYASQIQEQPATPVNTTPQVVKGANIQSDIPSDNPEGMIDQSGTVGGKDWTDIINTDYYKNLTMDRQLALRKQFEAQGGKAVQRNEGLVDKAANFTAGGLIGTAETAVDMVGGLELMASDVITNTSKVAGDLLGIDDKNNWGVKAGETLHNEVQSGLNYAHNLSEEVLNTTGISSSSSGQAGRKYVPMAAQGALIAVTGGGAAIPLAIGAGGQHYAQTPEKDRSILKSATIGGMQAVMNEVLPGSGGNASNLAKGMFTKDFEAAISPQLEKILSTETVTSIKNAGAKVVGGAVNTGESSVIGGATGYGVGAGSALIEGKSFKEAHESGVDSMKEGAVMGAGFHSATKAIEYTPKILEKVGSKFGESKLNTNDVKKSVQADLDRVNEKAHDPEAMDREFETATHLNSVSAIDDLKSRNFEPVAQTARGNKAAGEIYGVNAKDAGKKQIDLDATKANVAEVKKDILSTNKNARTDNEDVYSTLETKANGEIKTEENVAIDTATEKLIKAHRAFESESGKAKHDPSVLRKRAVKVHEALEELNAIAPEQASYFSENITSPITGKVGDSHFTRDAHLHNSRSELLDASTSILNGKKPNVFSKTAEQLSHYFGLHYLAHHVLGPTGNVVVAVAKPFIDKVGASRRAAKRTEQAEQFNKNAEKARIEDETVKPAIDINPDYTTGEGRAKARYERTVKSGVKSVKEQFKDHPDLADQINESNFSDKEFISGLKSDLKERVTKQHAEARTAEREAQAKEKAKANDQAVKEYTDANPHLKTFIAEARNNLGKGVTVDKIARETESLAYGRKSMSTGENKKSPFKAGSKEEFLQEANHGRLVSDDLKTELRSMVELYFKDNGGKLTTDGQKKLHRAIANRRARWLEKEGEASDWANEARERGEILAKRVDTRAAIERKNSQHEAVENAVTDAFKDSGLSERSRNKFLKAKREEIENADFKTHAEFNEHLDKVKAEAKKFAETKELPKQPKQPSSKFKEGDEVIWANKDFDLPVKFVGHAEDGFARVRPAIVDGEGKITGYGEERYLPLSELKSSKRSKPNEENTPQTSEERKITVNENNKVRDRNNSKLADAVLKGDEATFDKLIDEKEAFEELYSLSDSATSEKTPHFIEALYLIMERKKKGITDPELLLSSTEWGNATGQGLKFGEKLRHAVGEKGDWKPSLHPEERAKQETDFTSGAKAEREAKAKADAELKAKQKANKAKREAMNARFNVKR